jgi:hypothetical protein
MGRLLYLFTILIFVGGVLTIEVSVARGRVRKYSRLLLMVFILGIIASLTDALARHWGVWEYSMLHTLHTQFLGVELESIIYTPGVALAITIPAILWADDLDAHISFLAGLKRSNKNPSSEKLKAKQNSRKNVSTLDTTR